MNSNIINVYQKENLSHMVDDYIKDMILRGVYKEGDRILEVEIAEKLGISRGPVREGIKAVEQAGILTVEARKGAYVTRFDKNDVQEVFEIRQMLENSILEDLINNKKMTESDLQTLYLMVADMEAVAKSTMPVDERMLLLNKKDIEFHQYIWGKSGSKRKMRILNDIFFQLRLAMLYDTKLQENLTITASGHYSIVECLQKGDLENCKKALKDHILTC